MDEITGPVAYRIAEELGLVDKLKELRRRVEEEAKEEKRIHCFAYMDTAGRILIPLRNREEAGIA